MSKDNLFIHIEVDLEDCPFCGGPGVLEEENGWCWYVACADCGSQTAAIEYKSDEESPEAARKAADLWNSRKVLRSNIGE